MEKKDWFLSKKMIQKALDARHEDAESSSLVWQSGTSQSVNACHGVYCGLQSPIEAKSCVTLTYEVGDGKGGRKIGQMSFPLILWNQLLEKYDESITEGFRQCKIYRTIMRVNDGIFPWFDDEEMGEEGGEERGERGGEDGEKAASPGGVSSL